MLTEYRERLTRRQQIEVAAQDDDIARRTNMLDDLHQLLGLLQPNRTVALACWITQTVQLDDGDEPFGDAIANGDRQSSSWTVAHIPDRVIDEP